MKTFKAHNQVIATTGEGVGGGGRGGKDSQKSYIRGKVGVCVKTAITRCHQGTSSSICKHDNQGTIQMVVPNCIDEFMVLQDTIIALPCLEEAYLMQNCSRLHCHHT